MKYSTGNLEFENVWFGVCHQSLSPLLTLFNLERYITCCPKLLICQGLNVCLSPHPNLYVEDLTPTVVVFGDGVLGSN